MRGAFGYIRVSSPGQALDDRDGFARQKEAIERYAAANGIKVGLDTPPETRAWRIFSFLFFSERGHPAMEFIMSDLNALLGHYPRFTCG